MTHTLYLQEFRNVVAPQEFQEKCQKSADNLSAKIKNIAAINIVNQDDDIKIFAEIAKKISSYKKILILGVGGSSLGGKTLSALKFQDRVEFLESIDPATIKNCLDKFDLEKTFFLVVSKSGETIETICQTLIILDQLPQKNMIIFYS
jgi:glucose-6-phosphate isomerase